ncbi:hypothetical protein CMV_005355 [Castanea mollissima]|uniref:Uncharacterized protein n=1 Tax=Castanea mollissima TaxID=60419 RepID=A0A8J4VSF7_9ROSI|nr:hypothetical protein CMV_005355 [Castanea mollissima]
MSFLQQQRIMQLQQQENQQLLKAVPEQQPHLHKQFQQQTLPITPAQHRPEDNNIEFWRKFVAESNGGSMKRGYQLTCLRRSVVKKKRKIKNIFLSV